MSYAKEFQDFVRHHAPDKPSDTSTYSGSTHVHYGLSNPTMRDFVKQWANNHPDLTYQAWEQTQFDLYRGKSIDERALAGFMLGQYPAFRQQLPLTTLDTWIAELVGWREIDTTCQSNFSATEVLTRWSDWEPFLTDLSQRDTIQHRRASLVLLIRPLREGTDERLLNVTLQNFEHLKHETDKLITKAVSWVLRQSIKHYRDAVGTYVTKNEATLPAIAVREFHKKYTTGKK